MLWDTWKKGFEAWEGTTAKYLESVLKNPAFLNSSGTVLSALMKAKASYENAIARTWSTLGLSSRRDQERALHTLNQMQSRLFDLEERLHALRANENEALQLKAGKKRDSVADILS